MKINERRFLSRFQYHWKEMLEEKENSIIYGFVMKNQENLAVLTNGEVEIQK